MSLPHNVPPAQAYMPPSSGTSPASADNASATSPRASLGSSPQGAPGQGPSGGVSDAVSSLLPRSILAGSDAWRTHGVTSPRPRERAAHFHAALGAEAAMLSPAERVFASAASAGVVGLAGGRRARSIGRFRETETGFHPATHAQVRGGRLPSPSFLLLPALHLPRGPCAVRGDVQPP